MSIKHIYDSHGGIASTIHFRDARSEWHTQRTQDVEPILDFNKALINEGHNGFTPSRDMRRVANIPLVIMEKWQKEFCHAEGHVKIVNGTVVLDFGNRDRKRWLAFLKGKLNNDDNKFFRTVEGKL